MRGSEASEGGGGGGGGDALELGLGWRSEEAVGVGLTPSEPEEPSLVALVVVVSFSIKEGGIERENGDLDLTNGRRRRRKIERGNLGNEDRRFQR